MAIEFSYLIGQMHITPEEIAELKHVDLKSEKEIQKLEKPAIDKTVAWVEKNYFKAEKIFTEAFIKEVHKRMFFDTWQWGGKYRLTNKNLGVDKSKISSEIKQLMSNTRFWIEDESYDMDEIALRFVHRLTQIQPFPDGNARHAKIMGNVILEHLLNSEIFSWGESISDEKMRRAQFIEALQKADKGNIEDLLKFARS